MLEQCFADQGKGDRCLICPLAQATTCLSVLKRLQRLQRDSRNRDYKVSEADRQSLLQETLNAVIRRVNKALQESWDIDHIGAYTQSVFQKKRANFYSKAPRFGDWSTVVLDVIPTGLPALATRYAGDLRLEGKFLAATAMMERVLYEELLGLSAGGSWKKSVDLLYTNTWKGLLEGEEGLNKQYSANTGVNPEERLLQRERWQNALSPYVRLWSSIGGEQAKNCAKLFSDFGQDLISDESGYRSELAAVLNIQENTLNKRISRCYALIHDYLTKVLSDMSGDEPQSCLRLYTQIYGAVGQGMGMQQRLDKAAETYGVSRETINSRLRSCRKLVMGQIEW